MEEESGQEGGQEGREEGRGREGGQGGRLGGGRTGGREGGGGRKKRLYVIRSADTFGKSARGILFGMTWQMLTKRNTPHSCAVESIYCRDM